MKCFSGVFLNASKNISSDSKIMRNTLICIFLMWAAGSVQATIQKPWEAHGALQIATDSGVVPPTPLRYIEHADKTPFFWLGDTAWLMPHRLTIPEAETYFTNRQKNGFSIVQIMVTGSGSIDGLLIPSHNAATGLLPFHGVNNGTPRYNDIPDVGPDNLPDPEKPVEDFFTHLDQIIDLAEQNGIYVALAPAWARYVCRHANEESYTPEVFNANNAFVYGQWIGNRYKNKPNLLWMFGGDHDYCSNGQVVWDALANGIRTAGDSHLITYHPGRFPNDPNDPNDLGGRRYSSSAGWLFDRDLNEYKVNWLDFGASYPNRRVIREVNEYAYNITTPVKPTILAEAEYFRHQNPTTTNPPPPQPDSYIRAQPYWSILSGAAGYTYGNTHVWWFDKKLDTNASNNNGIAFPDRRALYQIEDSRGWSDDEYLDSLGTRWAVIWKNYFSGIAWQNLIPDQNIILTNPGNGSTLKTAARSSEGDRVLVYFPNSSTSKIDFGKITTGGSNIEVRWLNPMNGNNILIDRLEAPVPASQNFSIPTGWEDGLLILERTNKTAPELSTQIAKGINWKYMDNGENQGIAWQSIAFDDTAWQTGNTQLGYGDGDEVTVVGFGGDSGNKYITTYFRHLFNTTNVSAIEAVTLELLRDDGAVVHLNGTEVVRSNMPIWDIDYQTTAENAISGADEDTYNIFSINPALLVEGDNVLAVEIHQATPGSSDISFDLELGFQSSSGLNDHGNTRNTATPISVDSTISGSLEELADQDYFRIDITRNGVLTVNTLGGVDTEGTLENSVGGIVAFNDNGFTAPDYNFKIVQAVTIGTYFVKVGGYNDEQTGSYSLVSSFTPSDAIDRGSVDVQINADSDDAEEYNSTGEVSLASSDLEFVFDDAFNTTQMIGLRFNEISIPRNAIITNAYIQFQVDEKNTGATTVTFKGEASDNATTFSATPNNISARGVTSSEVSWQIPAWNTNSIGMAGPDQRTPDLSSVIQEIISRPGWSNGNSIAIITTGNGKRTAESFNGDAAGAARLYIDWSFASTNSIDVQITADSDDAEEYNSTGEVSLASSDLEFVFDDAFNTTQMVGLRFNEISIPKSAIITNAYIQFQVDEKNTGATTVTFKGEASDNATTFSATPNNISARGVTSSEATWQIPAWNTSSIGTAGLDQQTPDLSSIIQEIISRPGWQNGNSIAIIITGNGKRTAESFDGDAAGAARLYIDWRFASTNNIIDVQITADSDDAEEYNSTGEVSLSSSDLEFVFDGAFNTTQMVGLRFNEISIPQNASITNAYIQFQVDEKNTEATTITFKSEASDNATTFSVTPNDISAREVTSSEVSWQIPAWNTSSIGAAGPDQQSPDLAPVIQEVISRAGWNSGNSLAIIITGNGIRKAESFNGDAAGAPQLHIEWSQ